MTHEEFKEKIKTVVRRIYKVEAPEVEPLASDHYLNA